MVWDGALVADGAPLLMKQAIAVIDNRTTPVCLHVAGQIRLVEEPFETLLGDQDEPPFHYGCRTMVAPWMAGFVNEMRRDANAELLRRPKKQRRIGPGGETGPLPPKVRNPSSPPNVPIPAAVAEASTGAEAVAAATAATAGSKKRKPPKRRKPPSSRRR